jgi:hypothetical protein
LEEQGFAPEQLPSLSTMAEVLNRMGYRLWQVVKAKPQKNFQKRTRFLTISTVYLNRKVYPKGISRTKSAMRVMRED